VRIGAPAAPRTGPSWRTLQLCLALADACCLWAGLTLAYSLRLSSGLLAYHASYSPAAYRGLILAMVPLWLGLNALVGLYDPDRLMGGLEEYQLVLRACSFGTVVLVMISFFWREMATLSRGWLVMSWIFASVCLGGERFLARRLVRRLRRRGWFVSTVLVVGASDQGVAMARQWLDNPTCGMRVLGFLDDFKPVGTKVVDGLEVLARPTALPAIAERVQPDEVVVVPTAVAWETFQALVARAPDAGRYKVRVSPGFYELLATGVAVTNKSFVPLFTINRARLTGIDAVIKRALDCAVGLALLIATAPVLAVAALVLKLGRQGRPALRRFQTLGLAGKPFTMYKFNVIVDGTPGDGAPGQAGTLHPDGLAKLPQLLNVLRGQMSLVGPRPRVVGDCNVDPQSVPNLQTVKPGITGPWAVMGGWKSADEVQDDLYYVRNWTIWLDVQILFQSLLNWATPGR
jgi:lipopolysaccharide/colanic/teichoic acid biosynthesis glycosyltransferase